MDIERTITTCRRSNNFARGFAQKNDWHRIPCPGYTVAIAGLMSVESDAISVPKSFLDCSMRLKQAKSPFSVSAEDKER